jgi:hypothetical protein
MKLLPLSVKKKLSKVMKWFEFGTAITVICGSFLAGVGGMIAYQNIGDKNEKTVLQQKVDHLLTSHRVSRSMHTIVEGTEKGGDFALNLPKAREKEAALTAAFNAEAEATGVALVHARGISPAQRSELYKQLGEIKPQPDYFKNGTNGADDFILFSFAQSRVMNRPGFTPTIETAREITAYPDLSGLVVAGSMFGPLLLSIGGIFSFCSARRRLDDSIHSEESAIRGAEDAARRLEREKAQKEEAEAVARKAVEAAEAERLAKLPPSVELDRDISVRQIRLTGKGQIP